MKTKLCNDTLDYAMFISEVVSGAWPKERTQWTKELLERITDHFGEPESYPVTIGAVYEPNDDPECYGIPFATWKFGEIKTVEECFYFK